MQCLYGHRTVRKVHPSMVSPNSDGPGGQRSTAKRTTQKSKKGTGRQKRRPTTAQPNRPTLRPTLLGATAFSNINLRWYLAGAGPYSDSKGAARCDGVSVVQVRNCISILSLLTAMVLRTAFRFFWRKCHLSLCIFSPGAVSGWFVVSFWLVSG